MFVLDLAFNHVLYCTVYAELQDHNSF